LTGALGGALLLSALVAQARGPGDLDAGPPAPTPLVAASDAGAPTDGSSGPVTPVPGASSTAAGLSATSGLSLQAPLPPPPEPKPADINKPVGLWLPPHYDEGFVLVSTPDSAPLPYLLRLNHVSQFKYTNSMAVHPTYTTHLGEVKDVNRRNDFQLTRDVFYFSGYVYDKRLDYNIILYTSTADLTAAAAGYVGYVFHKAFALRAGFFSLPSLRAMTGTYPYFAGTDRSMEVNYMRPGFTQGVWANGEPLPGLNYIAMIGNSLNTLNIAASRIDYRFAYAISLWYDINSFGKAWNDYEHHESPSLRLGTAFTYAREDRLSDLSEANPENNSTYMSDGTLLFGTGTLAPNVTVSLASYYLYAVDAGIKFRGFAFNVEFAFRWLDKFVADGPLPIANMFDWGFDSSLGYFVVPKRLETSLRSSLVAGPFATAVEGAIGAQWYPFPTRQVWLSLEAIGIKNCPYTSALYIYSSGQTGLLVPAQLLVRF
jgi:hypothetical protein